MILITDELKKKKVYFLSSSYIHSKILNSACEDKISPTVLIQDLHYFI